jgi:hypothetical protein
MSKRLHVAVALLLIQELRPNRAAQRKKKIATIQKHCATHDTHVGVDGFTKLQGYAIETNLPF